MTNPRDALIEASADTKFVWPKPIVQSRFLSLRTRSAIGSPTLAQITLAIASAILLILSFSDFNLWPLAWIGFVPLFVAVASRPRGGSAFFLGWLTGAAFFCATCDWLTYVKILSPFLAYLLLFISSLWFGVFTAIFCTLLARTVTRWGRIAIFAAPFLWASLEWVRLGITGQLWNAIGYSQAYIPVLLQAARWGGVYAVGFLIVTTSSSLAYLWLEKSKRAAITCAAVLLAIVGIVFVSQPSASETGAASAEPEAVVVAVQPNVPTKVTRDLKQTQALFDRHLTLSTDGLRKWEAKTMSASHRASGSASLQTSTQGAQNFARLVVWPESPLNLSYSGDPAVRARIAEFTTKNHASLIFNSIEPAGASGAYNAALMVNEEGRLAAQYNKTRLMPFGEYVPLPHWLARPSQLHALVRNFVPGKTHPLMPVGDLRAGVFICIESAYPPIPRALTKEGADVLINIFDDAYLGRAVMRQHLANAILRAVENNRPVVSVSNTGTTAFIDPRGHVDDATAGFQAASRTWTVTRAGAKTFYTRRGDLFVGICAAIALLLVLAAQQRRTATWLQRSFGDRKRSGVFKRQERR